MDGGDGEQQGHCIYWPLRCTFKGGNNVTFDILYILPQLKKNLSFKCNFSKVLIGYFFPFRFFFFFLDQKVELLKAYCDFMI